MKRLGFAGSLLIGVFAGAYFFHTEGFPTKLRDVLGLDSRAEPAPASSIIARRVVARFIVFSNEGEGLARARWPS
jgi:hypothetical protein